MRTVLDLTWREVAGGFESGSYRVEPLRDHAGHNWRLLVSAPPAGAATARWPSMPTIHRTLRGAYAQARHIERERIRHTRLIRHLVVGSAAALLFMMLLALVASLLTFILALVLLVFALRSLAVAAVLAVDNACDWTEEGSVFERETRLESMVDHALSRLRPRPPIEPAVESRVRVLPPVPPA